MSTAFDYTDRAVTTHTGAKPVAGSEVSSVDDTITEDYRPSTERIPYETYGPRFSQAVLNSPMFEGKDVAGLIGAAVMTLGPLAAYSFGFGA